MHPDPLRVLLVEDEPTDAAMTQAMLRQVRGEDITVHWVATFTEGLAELGSRRHDVALVDYLLGSANGLDLLREAVRLEVETPIILLTGQGSHEVDVEAQEAGAADYLVKGRIDPAGLDRALRYTLERTRARAALRESEARFRGMFDHLPLGLFRCTPDGGFLDANPALVRLLGNPDAATLAQRHAAHFYVHPSDGPRLSAALAETGVVRGFESWLERADGFHVPVRVTARAHRDATGAVAYVEGAVADIDEIDGMSRLRLAHARFRAVVEGLPVALVACDPQGHVLDVARGLTEALGHAPADLVAEPLARILDPSGATRFDEALAALAAGLRVAGEFKAEVRGRDGAMRRCSVAYRAVFDDEGEVAEVLVLLTPQTPKGP